MDIASHGFWGALAFGRRARKSFWLSFIFGALPDFIPFAPVVIEALIGNQRIFIGHGAITVLPNYVHGAYNVTHSLVVFIAAFVLVWLVRKKPFFEMSAWGLHILFDIPFHTKEFFPTPFLWPLSDFSVDGIPWSSPGVFIPNIILLILLYVRFWYITDYKPRHSLK